MWLPISSHSAISVNNLEERIECVCVCNLPWFLVKKKQSQNVCFGASQLFFHASELLLGISFWSWEIRANRVLRFGTRGAFQLNVMDDSHRMNVRMGHSRLVCVEIHKRLADRRSHSPRYERIIVIYICNSFDTILLVFFLLCIFLAFLNSLALGMWFANRIVLLLFCIR